MRVILYDETGILDSETAGNTVHGVPVPRVGECVYGENPRMRGEVLRISYHYDHDDVHVYVATDRGQW